MMIYEDDNLTLEQRYNMLEGHGYKAMARELLDNPEEEVSAYQLTDGTYAVVQTGKGFASQEIEECKCVLPEQSCGVCNRANEIPIYPPMPGEPVSSDYFEMWEMD
jgi:hypothetical protein